MLITTMGMRCLRLARRRLLMHGSTPGRVGRVLCEESPSSMRKPGAQSPTHTGDSTLPTLAPPTPRSSHLQLRLHVNSSPTCFWSHHRLPPYLPWPHSLTLGHSHHLTAPPPRPPGRAPCASDCQLHPRSRPHLSSRSSPAGRPPPPCLTHLILHVP